MKADEIMEIRTELAAELAVTLMIWEALAKIVKEPVETALKTGQKYQPIEESRVEDMDMCFNDLIGYYGKISANAEKMVSLVKEMKKDFEDSQIRITKAEIYESND